MIPYIYLMLKTVFIINLIYLAVTDFRTMNVPVKGQAIAFATVCACLLLSVCGPGAACDGFAAGLFTLLCTAPSDLIAGGLVLFLVSASAAVFTGGLGGGDVKIYATIGLGCGLAKGLEIMMYSLLLSGIFCLFLRLLPKTSRHFRKIKNIREIPLLPFIAFCSVLQFVKNALYCL